MPDILESLKNLEFIYDGKIPRADRMERLRQCRDDLYVKQCFEHMMLPYRNTYCTAEVGIDLLPEVAPDAFENLFSVLERCIERTLSGNAAKYELSDALCGFSSFADVMAIIANKSTPPGLGAGSIVKVWPHLEDPFQMPGCRGDVRGDLFTAAYARGDVWNELKYDGIRLWFIRENGERRVLTRGLNNLYLPNFLHYFEEFEERMAITGRPDCDNYVFDTEIEFEGNRRITNGLCHRTYDWTPEEKEKMIVRVFAGFHVNVLNRWIKERTPCEFTHRQIRNSLENMFTTAVLPPRKVFLAQAWPTTSLEDTMDRFKEITDGGKEGLIAKIGDGKYVFVDDCQTWAKLKFKDTTDAEIIDYVEGVGRLVGTLGSLVVLHRTKKRPDGVAVHVGSGYSDEERNRLWAIRDQLRGKWLEFTHFGETPDGSLDHAVYGMVRDDR